MGISSILGIVLSIICLLVRIQFDVVGKGIPKGVSVILHVDRMGQTTMLLIGQHLDVGDNSFRLVEVGQTFVIIVIIIVVTFITFIAIVDVVAVVTFCGVVLGRGFPFARLCSRSRLGWLQTAPLLVSLGNRLGSLLKGLAIGHQRGSHRNTPLLFHAVAGFLLLILLFLIIIDHVAPSLCPFPIFVEDDIGERILGDVGNIHTKVCSFIQRLQRFDGNDGMVGLPGCFQGFLKACADRILQFVCDGTEHTTYQFGSASCQEAVNTIDDRGVLIEPLVFFAIAKHPIRIYRQPIGLRLAIDRLRHGDGTGASISEVDRGQAVGDFCRHAIAVDRDGGLVLPCVGDALHSISITVAYRGQRV